MNALTDEEIKKLKTDFIRNMKPGKVYENKSEIKDDLILYRDLIAIRDPTERLFVNQMITIANKIPEECIGEWKKKKTGRKTKGDLGTCDLCNTPYENREGQLARIRKEYSNSFLSPMRERKLSEGELHCPKLTCPAYNLKFGGD